jgi:hypothetical protein
MASEPISTAYFINPLLQSVCLSACVSLLSFVSKGSVNTTNARNTRRIVGRVSVYPLSLLGIISENTFPRQRIIIRGGVFYEVGVVWKESEWLVLLRTACLSFESVPKLN